MNKRFFVAGILTAFVVVSPFATSALSVADLQAQIQTLLARISAMQATATLGTNTSVSSDTSLVVKTPRICGILNRNLSRGAQGDDVRGLQEFLTAEGVLNASATGYFGPATANALARWQANAGVQGVGSVGPLTRDLIMRRCGNPSSSGVLSVSPERGTAPLAVNIVSKTGDAGNHPPSWVDGRDTMLDFGDGSERIWLNCPDGTWDESSQMTRCATPIQLTHTYAKDGTYKVSIVKSGGMCMGGCAETTIASRAITVGSGPVACTMEYKPVCGAKPVTCITTPCNPVPTTYGNTCQMRADGASYLYEGQCHDAPTYNPETDASCKSWNDGCNTCTRSAPGQPAMCTLRACTPESMTKPYCTARFDDSQGSGTPVISGFSGPVSLGVNETGTWRISASDPENGRLSYSIVWGDEWVRGNAGLATSADSSIVQQTTFTHAYSNPGNYTVALTVTDESGKSAQTTASVQVSQSLCTAEYSPVCGRPQGCMNTCPSGMMCTMMCALHDPVTYSNRCQMNNANANFIHTGACTGSETY